ncbi:hypothetical protein C8E03_10819 [Lachnotalea glycerini]|uniref:Uncharacterized protein n=1 Tax=Lachnotalea glycerini TaxID=1763509 RepID=A0A255IP12_9FIRM|nr:hypothetical protein CG709_06145 [Lachnotalea glycerini]PXV88298.1 hypothetical protein C8E03_10819 [Lachnotalea glycerini]RDY30878.1 hypothetical protein CG710_012460 [Lachnotalea glycerini]
MKENVKTRIIKFIIMCLIMAVIYGFIQTGDVIRDYITVFVIAGLFALIEVSIYFYRNRK